MGQTASGDFFNQRRAWSTVLNTRLQKHRVDVKSYVTRLKSSELTNCFIRHHKLVKSYKEALDATIVLLKDNCKSERAHLYSSNGKEFEIACSYWKVWHPTFIVIEAKRRQLKDSATLLQYFRYCDQLACQKTNILKFKVEVNVIVRAEGRVSRIKPEIEKMQTLLEDYEEIVEQKIDLLRTQSAQKSHSRRSSQELRREIEPCLKLEYVEKSEAKQTGLTVSFEDEQDREETSFNRSSILMSNPTENTNVVPSEVDNDDAEDQQPADGEKEDDSSKQKKSTHRKKN